MLWDITTKFSPVEDLIRSQLFTNFDGYSLKNGAAMPLTISNFPRAWQAYFLSNTLQIWWENTSFDNLQMMWNNVFDTSIGFGFEKIWLSRTVHIYSLYLIRGIYFYLKLKLFRNQKFESQNFSAIIIWPDGFFMRSQQKIEYYFFFKTKAYSLQFTWGT